ASDSTGTTPCCDGGTAGRWPVRSVRPDRAAWRTKEVANSFEASSLAIRILGPPVLRVPAPELLADFGIAARPEAPQVARHLHRPTVRRQQFEGQRRPAPAETRRVDDAEQFLELHRDKHAALAVLDGRSAAA